MRAKIATEFGKPRGVYRLTRHNWMEVMGDRPTTALWGVGNRIAGRMAGVGISTVRELAEAPDGPLIGEFGPNTGPHLGRLGRGAGSAIVDGAPWVARAHGHETTYQRDLTSAEEVVGALHTLADQVVKDLQREGRGCARVHLKVRFAPFFTVNRSRKLPEPTFDPDLIGEAVLDLYRKLEDERPIRLLGVRLELAMDVTAPAVSARD